jgi:hypothetical protein
VGNKNKIIRNNFKIDNIKEIEIILKILRRKLINLNINWIYWSKIMIKIYEMDDEMDDFVQKQ